MTRRVVLCLPDGTPRADPSPDETAKRDVEFAYEWNETAAGVIGWAEGGRTALDLAAGHGDLVDRLVLVSTPVPPDEKAPASMTTKVLLLYGARDGGSAEARWWQNAIGGRIEMVPGEGRDILERVWPRALFARRSGDPAEVA